jgi:NAD(P)H-dependent flavin oxidoreductase YrpB (nitropropane dioxygenase family)
VWVGTRFLATPEAVTVPGYKEKLLQTTSRDTVVTEAYTGKPCRVIRNEFTERVAREGLPGKQAFARLTRADHLRINHLYNPARPGVNLDVRRRVYVCVCVFLSVSVCVRETERKERDRAFVCLSVCLSLCAPVHALTKAHVCLSLSLSMSLSVSLCLCVCLSQEEFMPCGQVVGALRAIEPAHTVVNEMLLGARERLDRANRARL